MTDETDRDELLTTLDRRIEKALDGKRRAAERNGDFYGLSQYEWAQRLEGLRAARKDVVEHLGSSSTNWYAARFPDKGAGATRMSIYVEGPDEETARETAGGCDRLNAYDTTAGKLTATDRSREEVEAGLVKAGGPNEAITADGDVILRRDVRPDLYG